MFPRINVLGSQGLFYPLRGKKKEYQGLMFHPRVMDLVMNEANVATDDGAQTKTTTRP